MGHGITGSVEPGQPERFPLLFTPLRLGPVTIPNRIVSSGHDTVMAVDGKVSDQMVAYHAARAQGGAGLIVVQVAAIHSSARYSSHILMADDDACIPGLARLAAAVRSRGTPIFQQLFHDGRELMESADGTLPVAYAPSAVPNERFAVMPRALRLGVEILPLVRPYGADKESVYLQHVLTGEPVLIEPAAALVLSAGHLPVTGLAAELAGSGLDVREIGDCLAPRTVEEAVLEGLIAGCDL